MTLLWLLLLCACISSVYSTPFTLTWNITETADYVDRTTPLGSFVTEGISLTWSNPQCNPAVCIKRLLRPIPDQQLWSSQIPHCSHHIPNVLSPPAILPRIGFYHIMVYRSDPLSCHGVLTLNGSTCDANHVFDGKKCETPITGHALRSLTPGVPIPPFEIPPQLDLPDVGRKTFIFQNDIKGMKQGNLYVNASGLLTIHGRYGAVTRLSPLKQDFQYNMTDKSYTLSDPFQGMRFGSASNTTPSSYGFVEYVTFTNHGNTNITVYNITTSIDQCPEAGQSGVSCVPRIGDYLETVALTKTFLNQLPKNITSYAYFPLALQSLPSFITLKVLIQNVPAPNKETRILPDVYIRQGAIPTPFDGDMSNDHPDNHYDIFIPAAGKSLIYYDFGEFETTHDWYIAFHIPSPSGATLTPIVISVQQECAADCSKSGTCLNHQCQCNDGWTNYDCSIQQTPSDEIELPSSWRYSLFMLALIAPIILFFVLRRHLNNVVNRPSLASQGQGLGMGHPGHVLGGSDIQDSRRWQ